MADIDLAREAYDAWNPDDSDAWVAGHFTPDAEWVDAPMLPDAGVHHGIEEIQQMVRGLVSVAGPFEMHVREIIDAGDEALVVFHMVGRGEQSGLPVDLVPSHAVTTRDGKIARVRGFLSRDEGAQAVGLAPADA